jgi:diguanylate cyclase
MKYPQTRDETIELCRKAVPMMAQQGAGLHPLSYAVHYEHLSGLNLALSSDYVLRAASGALSESDIEELYETHIRDRQAQRVAKMLAQLVSHVIDIARQAGADLSQFRRALEERQNELREPLEQLACNAIVASLLGETERMRAITGEISESFVKSMNEVAALERRLKDAEEAAVTDSLTGLLNRRGFEQAVNARVSGNDGLVGSTLLFIDIDHFKKINDQFGHTLGDKVLCGVAELVRKTVREGDVVARIGGEEFAIFLPTESVERGRAVAENIRSIVSSARIIGADGESIGMVTVSVGISRGQAGETLLQLLGRADAAMYKAKEKGRDRVFLYDEESEFLGGPA